MKRLRNIIIGIGFALFVAAPVTSVALPVTSSTFAAAADCERSILGIPPWYRGLTNGVKDDCSIAAPEKEGDLGPFVWRIVLNIINMVLVIIGYIAFFFILYAGFLYLTGGANPSQLEKAKKTITNAIVGLVIALVSTILVNFIFKLI